MQLYKTFVMNEQYIYIYIYIYSQFSVRIHSNRQMKCILTKEMAEGPNSVKEEKAGMADGGFLHTIVFTSEFNTKLTKLLD